MPIFSNNSKKFRLPFDFCDAINRVARPQVTLFEQYGGFETKLRKQFTSSYKRVNTNS